MIKKMTGRKFLIVMIMASLLGSTASPAAAAVKYFPGVTQEMTSADYWMTFDQEADRQLLDAAGIRHMNVRMMKDPACCMFDLEHFDRGNTKSFDPAAQQTGDLQTETAQKAYQDICDTYAKEGYYDGNGVPVDVSFADQVRASIEGADPAYFRTVRYGIAVHRTDLRAYPTDSIITDEAGDTDFDYVQLSGVAVNEPLIIQGQSADGQWYYCCTDNCGGWIRSIDAAICRSREEWLSAWKIPDEKVLVVTESRFALEYSNTEPEISGLVLTMGTVLERADSAGTAGGTSGERITNRAAYQNHVVWIPVRKADGSYSKVKALISERHGVSEGYIPLTRRNILRTAMNALGDMYGWGGMLSAEDCSGFLHAVYACFGIRLPRNTNWQAAAPLFRYDLNYLPDKEKMKVISGLPAGTMLYFKGHAMLFLGEKDGKAYVLSSVSSMMDPSGAGRIRVRSVVINSLDIMRPNGNSWLSSLHTAVIPWLDAGETGSGWRSFGDGIRYRRENGSFAALNWQQVGEDWYCMDEKGLRITDSWIPSRSEENTWYYVGSDGKMARDTVIDGWPVDQDGRWKAEN